jgi:hypothetical protein
MFAKSSQALRGGSRNANGSMDLPTYADSDNGCCAHRPLQMAAGLMAWQHRFAVA